MKNNGFKPGALAITVKCTEIPAFNDKIVVLVRALKTLEFVELRGSINVMASLTCPGWLVESKGSPFPLPCGCCGLETMAFPPENLRIIGDPTGADETLEWAPVPADKVTA